jgi:hypothetical protein
MRLARLRARVAKALAVLAAPLGVDLVVHGRDGKMAEQGQLRGRVA